MIWKFKKYTKEYIKKKQLKDKTKQSSAHQNPEAAIHCAVLDLGYPFICIALNPSYSLKGLLYDYGPCDYDTKRLP